MRISAGPFPPALIALAAAAFAIGTSEFVIMGLLQTLIVHHAQAAPNLASTLNQAAFNLGNAIGAWIGSRMLSAGLPLADLSWASIALTLTVYAGCGGKHGQWSCGSVGASAVLAAAGRICF